MSNRAFIAGIVLANIINVLYLLMGESALIASAGTVTFTFLFLIYEEVRK